MDWMEMESWERGKGRTIRMDCRGGDANNSGLGLCWLAEESSTVKVDFHGEATT